MPAIAERVITCPRCSTDWRTLDRLFQKLTWEEYSCDIVGDYIIRGIRPVKGRVLSQLRRLSVTCPGCRTEIARRLQVTAINNRPSGNDIR